jgi:hypothetical protein
MRARTKSFPKIAVIEAKFQEDYEWLAITAFLHTESKYYLLLTKQQTVVE